jgi:SET family sugar efflux transporter-like MFS transporter
VRALFIASTLMWTCNSMYLINMPLYITRELGLEEKLAGLLMGTAAALEILHAAGGLLHPALRQAAHDAAGGAGRGRFLWRSRDPVEPACPHCATAQCHLHRHRGRHRHVLSGLDAGRAGVATTLFANSIRTGSIMAGAIAGTVAEIWSFHGVFMVATALALAALAACWRVPNV